MAGPWEKYQQAQSPVGPWTQYQTSEPAQVAPLPPRPAPEPDIAPWYQRAIPAFIEPMMESATAIRRQLAETLPEEGLPLVPMAGTRADEMARLAAQEEDLASIQEAAGPEGPFRTGMNIAGQVAEFAGPAGAGMALGRAAATRLPLALARTRAAAPLAGEVATTAGYEAARTEGTPEERAQAAVLAAGGAVGGHVAGGLLRKATEGVRRSREAQQLLDEGVRLTPGQAGAGRGVTAAEEALSNVVGWGGVNRLREQAVEDWSLNVLRQIAPGVTRSGQAGIKEAQDLLGNAYDKLTFQMARVEPAMVKMRGNQVKTSLKEAVGAFDDVTQQKISRRIAAEIENLIRKPSPQAWQNFNSRLRDQANKYRANGDLLEAEVFDQSRDALLELQPSAVRDRLTDLNRRYRDLVVTEQASLYQPSIEAGGVFGPVELLKAANRQGSRRMASAGEAAMQGVAQGGLLLSPNVATRRRSFMGEQIGPNVLVGGAGYLAGGPAGAAGAGLAGLPMATEPVRRALMGQTPYVQGPRARAFAKALARSSGAAGAGMAVTPERERR